MQNIDVNQAKKRLSELIEQSISEGGVVITKEGQPVAKLIPFTKPKKQRKLGTARGLIKISKDFDEPLEDFKEYI